MLPPTVQWSQWVVVGCSLWECDDESQDECTDGSAGDDPIDVISDDE